MPGAAVSAAFTAVVSVIVLLSGNSDYRGISACVWDSR